MTELVRPQLINGPFSDPGLYIQFLFERRAMMFDLGDTAPLSARQLLAVSHVFVSHAHMDHFAGFDRLLRICLGRDLRVHIFGPSGFLDRVEHKLAGYTWNLVQNYPADFTIVATELQDDGRADTAEFHVRTAFRREAVKSLMVSNGVLVDEEGFRIRAAVLDHGIPCLGFAFEEKLRINVRKDALARLGLPVGPWLAELKAAVRQELPDRSSFRVWWRDERALHERFVALGDLKAGILQMTPGRKVAYVTDVSWNLNNVARIAELAHGADILYIEAPFLEEDTALAAAKRHLTAAQAGRLARRAGAKRLVPFHFSPRYADREALLRAEAERAFACQEA